MTRFTSNVKWNQSPIFMHEDSAYHYMSNVCGRLHESYLRRKRILICGCHTWVDVSSHRNSKRQNEFFVPARAHPTNLRINNHSPDSSPLFTWQVQASKDSRHPQLFSAVKNTTTTNNHSRLIFSTHEDASTEQTQLNKRTKPVHPRRTEKTHLFLTYHRASLNHHEINPLRYKTDVHPEQKNK